MAGADAPSPTWLVPAACGSKLARMFMVDEATAAAIRRAWDEDGELAAVVELRRHFPLITDGETARRCVRAIVGWARPPAPERERG